MLDECGHNEAGRLVEVYDHPQPAPGLQVATVEALAAWRDVFFAEVWAADGVQDGIQMAQHLRTAPLEVAHGALVERDHAPVGIGRLARLACHRLQATGGFGWVGDAASPRKPSWLDVGCLQFTLSCLKDSREEGGLLRRRPRVQVATRGRESAVPHRRLDCHEVDPARREQRAVRVAQVVKAQQPQPAGVTSSLVAPAQRRAVERSTEHVAEHAVIG